MVTGDDYGFFHPSQLPATRVTAHLVAPQIAVSQTGSWSTADLPAKIQVIFWLFDQCGPPLPLESTSASAHSSTDSSTLSRKLRIVYVRYLNTEGRCPALLRPARQRRAGPIARNTSSIFNPTTVVFGMTPPVAQKSRCSGGGAGIDGSQNGITALVNQHSAFP